LKEQFNYLFNHEKQSSLFSHDFVRLLSLTVENSVRLVEIDIPQIFKR